MAIDYVIDYDCYPKQALGTEGILERLKGRERADTIIRLFRENGDNRPPSEMGFEFNRTTPEGETEPELIVVQDVLDQVAELNPLMPHCQNCPANRTRTPFGCMGFVQYPLSGQGEAWLLNQLPSIDVPLIWLLLKQGVEQFLYDGKDVALLRSKGEVYFEDRHPALRLLAEFNLSANQVFEMIFLVGHVIPNHASMLLLFFHAIRRDGLQADEIMRMVPATPELLLRLPFQHQIMQDDDRTIAELKEFFHALYIAWALNVRLLVDA